MKNRKKNTAPSMLDVAQKAGVCKSTVSYVLNGKPGVSDETRSRVLNACDELGYRINKSLQDFIRGKLSGITRNIAFVLVGRNFADPSYARLVDGIAAGAAENNYHLVLAKLSGNEESIMELPPILRDSRVDGVLISGHVNHQVIDVLHQLDTPIVILGSYHESITGDNSVVDLNVKGMYIRTIEYLKQQGKTRIAYFSNTLEPYNDKRCLGLFKDSLSDSGLPVNEDIIYIGSGEWTGAFLMMTEIFHQENIPFDTIFCPDYRSAIQLSYLMMAHKWRFGSTDVVLVTTRVISDHILPVPVVYMNSDMYDVAYEGVKILLNRVNDPDARPQKVEIIPVMETGDFEM